MKDVQTKIKKKEEKENNVKECNHFCRPNVQYNIIYYQTYPATAFKMACRDKYRPNCLKST